MPPITSWVTKRIQATLRRLKEEWARPLAVQFRRFLMEPVEQQHDAALIETDRMLMALFAHQPARAEPASCSPTFPAVNLGHDRLLAPHPIAGFIYLDAADDWVTPRLIAGLYEPGLEIWLQGAIVPETLVIDVGAGAGIETLTAARTLVCDTTAGHVLAIESCAARRRLLESNIRSHRLGRVVETVAEIPSAEVLRSASWSMRRVVIVGDASPDGVSAVQQVLRRVSPTVEVYAVFRSAIDCESVPKPEVPGALWWTLTAEGESVIDCETCTLLAGAIMNVPAIIDQQRIAQGTVRLTA